MNSIPQQGCVLSAYLIAFKKQSGKVCYAHESLFKILVQDSLIESAELNKKNSVNKWLTKPTDGKNTSERKVQFVELDDYIFARLNCKPNTLHYKESSFELKPLDKVEIVVNFPAVYERRRSLKKNDLGEYEVLPRKYLSDIEKLEYATRMLSTAGIEFDNVEFTENENRTIYFRKNRKTLTLLSYEVRVTATVTDPQLLLTAYQNGIGRRKTWGFGMLRIQKLKS